MIGLMIGRQKVHSRTGWAQCDELLFVNGADIKPNFKTTLFRHV